MIKEVRDEGGNELEKVGMALLEVSGNVVVEEDTKVLETLGLTLEEAVDGGPVVVIKVKGCCGQANGGGTEDDGDDLAVVKAHTSEGTEGGDVCSNALVICEGVVTGGDGCEVVGIGIEIAIPSKEGSEPVK